MDEAHLCDMWFHFSWVVFAYYTLYLGDNDYAYSPGHLDFFFFLFFGSQEEK